MNSPRGKQQIRDALTQVEVLRLQSRSSPAVLRALSLVKAYQCRRFEATYQDLLASDTYGPACRFFLNELYSPKDFSQRDAEFSKIAGAVERLFPRSIVDIAVALADLHALTEELDAAMAASVSNKLDCELVESRLDDCLYQQAWRNVERSKDRKSQLERVIQLGSKLGKVTRLPGIKLTLRAMRRPAAAANLSTLQQFLEEGFEIFANMAREQCALENFLAIINERESEWMNQLN
ncbi:FFLEELY motif protein [Rhodoferax mekongensis]|uniref:DUF8198 domain-containing protein n=1 Tax=Rhodoferax mekongensis TaxID=3068341 RepID=A0ABZ0AZ13_9BURK|nr:hypothetical protein [Rhodoferax sp. TBRC 17307]WNO04868.1 hypothetical protein RAN89_18580 [Rhodoferax sp. TBRC 17307]